MMVQAHARRRRAQSETALTRKAREEAEARSTRRSKMRSLSMRSKVGHATAVFETEIKEVEATEALNPLSQSYVGVHKPS